MNKNSYIYIAGHNGLVGSAVLRNLKNDFKNIIVVDRKKLDLRNYSNVKNISKIKKLIF